MKITIYCVLILSSILSVTFSDTIKFSLKEKDTNYYYCAILEGGIDFKILNPINSLSDFKREKKFLEKISPKEDANYYKVVSEKYQKILYGYSMKTHTLKELIKLDEKGRLKYKKIYQYNLNQTKECYWEYKVTDKTLISIEICDDNSKNIMYFNYNEKWKNYVKKEELQYENNELISKFIHDSSYSTVKIYDTNGTLILQGNTMGESDLCVPFVPYLVEE